LPCLAAPEKRHKRIIAIDPRRFDTHAGKGRRTDLLKASPPNSAANPLGVMRGF
jgi:hypothetical protein